MQGAQTFQSLGLRQSIPCALLGSNDTNNLYTSSGEKDTLSRIVISENIASG